MEKELLGSLELNRIYQMDCIEGMSLLPTSSVDLICIDPPYNIGKDKRWDKYKKDDYLAFMAEVFNECERVLKDNGSFYWFHNDMKQTRKLMDALDEETAFIFKQFIVWNKRYEGIEWVDKNNRKRGKRDIDAILENDGLRNYKQMAEYCLFYTFQDETGLTRVKHSLDNFTNLRNYFKDFQKATGLTKKAIIDKVGQRADHCFRWGSSQWDLPTPETYEALKELPIDDTFVLREYEDLRREYEDLRREYEELRYTFNNQKTHHSVWNYPIGETRVGHVTPKPLPLIENIVRHSSNPGDVILDCFGGSGTTFVGAERLGRRWIGFEREPEYIEISNQRLENIEDKDAEEELNR